MVLRSEIATRLAVDLVEGGAPGWPTFNLLQQMSDDELRTIHDVVVTKDLASAVSVDWLETHSAEASKVVDLLGTLQWSHQRELALYYREEVDRRVADRREKRMERLTLIATVAGALALLVAVLTLIVTA